MSEIVKPLREIAAEIGVEKLAADVNRNVNDPRSTAMFEKRRLNGVRRRHPVGAVQQSTLIIELALFYEEAYRAEDLFAIIDPATEKNVGSATLLHTLKLHENHRLLLPTPLARKTNLMEQVNKKYRLGSNVTAWVIDGYEELLEPAYAELVTLHKGIRTKKEKAVQGLPAMRYSEVPAQRAWTIEPSTSPDYVHSAIESAGMVQEVQGRFDDGELGILPYPTPRSTLYLSPPQMIQMPMRFDPSELSVVIRSSL